MPLHPMFVHFPIAFFTLFVLLEIIWIFSQKEWVRNSSVLTLFLGLLFAIPTLLSGEASAENFEKLEQFESLIETHETFAKLTVAAFFIAFIIKILLLKMNKLNTKTNWIVIAIALIGLYLLIQTGLKGGELVYKHGIATFQLKQN